MRLNIHTLAKEPVHEIKVLIAYAPPPALTPISRMDFLILISRTSPFLIVGVMGVRFCFSNFNRNYSKNSGCSDQTPHDAAFELDLH